MRQADWMQRQFESAAESVDAHEHAVENARLVVQLRQERDELGARLKQSESAAQNINRQWSGRHRALVQVLERAEIERDTALARAEAAESNTRAEVAKWRGWHATEQGKRLAAEAEIKRLKLALEGKTDV
jgi:multidrug resistance efflux pump